MIDLHCHLLPGVDDGAADPLEADAALRRMYDQGVRSIVVTPHVQASTLIRLGEPAQTVARLDEAWSSLILLGGRLPDLTLHRGVELMLDQPHPQLEPSWLRLGGTRFVLVEFLGMLVPPRAVEVLSELVAEGLVPVVAHPERYRNASPDCREALSWRQVGALLQVNCASLVGGYGPEPCRRAWTLLETGSVDYLASDYHARGHYPLVASRDALLEEDAAEQFDLLFSTNPARLLDDTDPLEVSPVQPRLSPWKKLVRRGKFW